MSGRPKIFALLLLAPLLGGCFQTLTGSVAGGECKVFERPPYAVHGATQYDQDVADNFVESGVGGCRWARPAARPAELDAAPAAKHVAKPAKKAKPVWLKMLQHWPHKAVAPVVVVPAAPAPVVEELPPPVVVPAPKRSALDELLHPHE